MSNSHEPDFEHRILYEQKALIEDGKQISTITYACSYLYPGGITRTTCRARTTLVYSPEGYNGSITVYGGTIEKWSDKGWMTIEEFFDTGTEFRKVEEAMTHMLNMFKSFILGISCLGNTIQRAPSGPPRTPNSPKKDPILRVLSFKDKIPDSDDNYKKETKKDHEEKGDPPDFDWI